MKRITSLVLALMLTIGFLPVMAQAETEQADQSANQPAGDYYSIAYIYNRSTTQLAQMDLSVLTHMNYAFATVSTSYGVTVPSSVQNGMNYIMGEIAARPEYSHLKLLLSIGGAGAGRFSEMASTSERRAAFIQSCMDVMGTYGIHGIDLDWEFPSMDGWGAITCGAEDRENYTLLIKELRAALDTNYPGSLLTIAGSGNTLFPEYWADMAEVSKYLDFINVMTYDYHYDGNLFDGPLTGSRDWPCVDAEGEWNIVSTINNYVSAGIPKDKLLIGWYGDTNGWGQSNQPRTAVRNEILRLTDKTNIYDVTQAEVDALIADGNLLATYAPHAYGALWYDWVSNAIGTGNDNPTWNVSTNPYWYNVVNNLDNTVRIGVANGVTKQLEFHTEFDRLAAWSVVYAYNLTDDPGREHKLFYNSYRDDQGFDARAEYIVNTGLKGIFMWSYQQTVTSQYNVASQTRALEEAAKEAAPTDYINLQYVYSSSVSAIDALDLSATTHINYAFGLIYNKEYTQPAGNGVPESVSGNPESWQRLPGYADLVAAGQPATMVEKYPELEHTVRVGEWNASGGVEVQPRPGETALHYLVAQRDKYAPDTKILLSVGGAGARGFSDMAASPETRAKFIQSCQSIIDEYGIDGIDFDWEFPSMDGWGGIKCDTANDRGNYTALLRELRQAMDLKNPGLLITAAGSGNTLFPTVWTNLKEDIKYLDFINIMTYDYRYGSSFFDFALGSSRDWTTLLTTDDWTADMSVQNYVSAGCPRNKINIGYKPGSTTFPSDARTVLNTANGGNVSYMNQISSSWDWNYRAGWDRVDQWWSGVKDSTWYPYKSPFNNTKYSALYWNWVNNALGKTGYNSAPYNTQPQYAGIEAKLSGGQVYTGTSGSTDKQIEFHTCFDRLAGLGVVYAYNLTDDPGRNHRLFVMSYNNADAVEARADFVKENGLLGVFAWQYTGDRQSWITKEFAHNLDNYTYATGVEIDKAELNLTVGRNATVTATVLPEAATNQRVRWSSSDSAVAEVSEDGLVIAKAVGSAVITAATDDGGFSQACAVQVSESTGELTWPFTATEWVLYTMGNINVDPTEGLWKGYEQIDDAVLVLRALRWSQSGMVSLGTNPATLFNTTNFPTEERNKFLQPDGEYYDLFQNLLDQFAEMVRLMLLDKLTPREDESWQNQWSRMQQLEYNFVDTPGWYGLVEAGRRVSVLGADTLYDNANYILSLEINEQYRQRFEDECYAAGKAVEKMIDYMDPDNPAEVAAARAAYDELDNVAKSCLMNYDVLKKAEGDGSYQKPDNLKTVGMRKPTGTDTGFPASSHISALDQMLEHIPGTEPMYIWIAGQSSGNLMAGTTDWDVLEASGCLKYPKEYYQQLGVNLIADPVGDEFFAYLDANYPDAQVYLQVENMNRFIEPQMDVLSYRAKQYNCIKGFALDIEWYNHSSTDCGLKVSDYRAQIWNEDIYSHWGSEYSLMMKHYSSFHLPDYYRGGGDGKSNPIIFVSDAQGSGSWDSTHGGKYDANSTGNGNNRGNGAFWAMYSQYVYPNTIVYQTGYTDDTQWIYNWENPFRDYATSIADVMAPDQTAGIVWVNFNRNDPRVFPDQIWRTPAQQAGDLAARYIQYLRDYLGGGADSPSGGNANLIGGAWGYLGPTSARPNNDLTVYDANAVRYVRQALNEIVARGDLDPNDNSFTNYTASQRVPTLDNQTIVYPVYDRFLEIEPRAFDIMVSYRYDIVKNAGSYKPARDKDNIETLADMYGGLTDAQKEAVVNIDEYLWLIGLVGSAPAVTSLAADSRIKNLVSGYSANVPVTVTTENADGLKVFAGVYLDGELKAQAEVAGGEALIKVGAFNFTTASVKAWIEGTDAAKEIEIPVKATAPTLWEPAASEYEGKVTIVFAEKIVFAASKSATVHGAKATGMSIADENKLEITGYSAPGSGGDVKVSGIKYPELFPSYSFTFTVSIP